MRRSRRGALRRLSIALAVPLVVAGPVPPAAADAIRVSAGGTSATLDSPLSLPDTSLCAPEDLACVSTTSSPAPSSSPSPSGSTVSSTSLTDLSSASVDAALGRPAVGVNFHGMWSDYTDQQRLAVLDKLAQAHVEWVRIDFGWASFEEACRGCLSQWAVDRADFLVDAAIERGLSVLGVLWTTPSWANAGAGAYTPPTDLSEYARIANWAASHFRGRVAAWEVWNEPNQSYFWVGGTAATYAQMLKLAYPKFKAGDPDALVVLGAPSYNDTPWLKAVYAAGAQGSFDVMATHPYLSPSNAPPETADPNGTDIWTLSHVASVRSLMQSYGDGAKEVWFTEFGWSDHENAPGANAWEIGVTQAQQADYFVRTITYLADTFPYVTNVFWYTERNEASGNLQLDNYGLLYRDLSPKPVYTRLQSFLADDAPPPPSADLAVTLTDSPDPVTAAANVTYTASVTNRGPSTATDVLVTFSRAVPDAAILVSASSGAGPCSLTTVATCTLGSLASGATVTARVVLTPLGPTATLNPTVTVTGTSADPSSANNAVSQPTTVTAAPMTAYVTISDSGFAPAAVTAPQGTTVQWNLPGPAGQHSVQDATAMSLFASGTRVPVSLYAFRFVGAGLYNYRDGVTGRTGSVTVPGKASPASGSQTTTFTITWASAPAAPGHVFDVQIQRPKKRAFATWRTGQTSVLSASFVPDGGAGTYTFRMRYRRTSNGAATPWVTTSIKVT